MLKEKQNQNDEKLLTDMEILVKLLVFFSCAPAFYLTCLLTFTYIMPFFYFPFNQVITDNIVFIQSDKKADVWIFSNGQRFKESFFVVTALMFISIFFIGIFVGILWSVMAYIISMIFGCDCKKIFNLPPSRSVGDFSNIRGKSLQNILGAIPPDAEKIPFNIAITEGTNEGIKYKWKDIDGVKWEVRIYNSDYPESIKNKTNNGWIIRIRKGNKYMDHKGKFYSDNLHNSDSKFYNPKKIKNTYIPIML
jgi:hypothetical protein